MFPFTAVRPTPEPDPVAMGVVTRPPVYVVPDPPVKLAVQSDRMDHHEKMRLRAAAFRVTRLYPGPVGELVSRELLSFEEFGLRLGTSGSVMRAVDHILKAPATLGPGVVAAEHATGLSGVRARAVLGSTTNPSLLGEPMPEPGDIATQTVITAVAVATHPAGTVLDEHGHPVLDDDGQPVTEEQK